MKVKLVCLFCGKEFYVKPCASQKIKYCSKNCASKDYETRLTGKNNPNYKNAGHRTCLQCGKVFHSYNKTRKYCSQICYHNSDIAKLVISKRKENVLPYPVCKKCGKVISKKYRKVCDGCKQGERRIGHCLNCGQEVKSRYDVQFCKTCRKNGEIVRVVYYSVCTSCGCKVNGYRRKYCNDCLREKYQMRRDTPHRVDENQKEIVDFLLKVGCSVLDTSAVGGGFPDLIIGYKNKNILIEIKNPATKNKLNKLQERFFSIWQGPIFVVHSIEEALEVLRKF